MKVLIDNQLPLALRNFLSARGDDAVHVLDIGMAQASDLEIVRVASRDERTIITKDEDFSTLAALGRCPVPVVWVRCGNCRTQSLLYLFSESLDAIEEKLKSGERVIQLLK